jgi:hypothetical protein
MLQRSQRSILFVLSLLILTTFLTSCSTIQPLEVFKTEVERRPLNLPLPAPAELEQVRWIIINRENAEEVFTDLEKKNIDPVIIGLTDEDYENFRKNYAQIRAYMIKQNSIIDAYKEYYEGEQDQENTGKENAN